MFYVIFTQVQKIIVVYYIMGARRNAQNYTSSEHDTRGSTAPAVLTVWNVLNRSKQKQNLSSRQH